MALLIGAACPVQGKTVTIPTALFGGMFGRMPFEHSSSTLNPSDARFSASPQKFVLRKEM